MRPIFHPTAMELTFIWLPSILLTIILAYVILDYRIRYTLNKYYL